MQMIDDVNSQSPTRNKNLESKGYGYLPLKTTISSNSSIFNDTAANKIYYLDC
jgi:hypothetical protein